MIELGGGMTNSQLVYINSGEWYRSIERIFAKDCRFILTKFVNKIQNIILVI